MIDINNKLKINHFKNKDIIMNQNLAIKIHLFSLNLNKKVN